MESGESSVRLTKQATFEVTIIFFFCPSKILHGHFSQLLLGLRTNAYAKFWRGQKEYYGKFENGLYLSNNETYFLNKLK